MEKHPLTSTTTQEPSKPKGRVLKRVHQAIKLAIQGEGEPVEGPVSQADFDVLDRIRQDGNKHPALRRLAIGILVVSGLLQSGGAIDKVAAPFIDAEAVVYEAGEALSPTITSGGKPSEYVQRQLEEAKKTGKEVTIDGIPLSRFSLREQEAYLRGETPASEEQIIEDQAIKEATDRVANLIDMVDKGDYASVIAASKQFEETHTFIGEERLNKTLEALNKAQNNDEIIKILQEHMAFYSIEVGTAEADIKGYSEKFSDGTSTNDARRVAISIVKTFGSYPTELTDLIELKGIDIGNSDGLVFGVYDGADTITMPTHTLLAEAATAVAEVSNGNDIYLEGSLPHELGHALDGAIHTKLDTGAPVSNTNSYTGNSNSKSDFIDYLKWNFRFLGNPIFGRAAPSGYALSDKGENFAETWRGLSTSTNDGMVRPDEVRHYTAEGMRGELQLLIWLERQFPGYAASLIAHNRNMIPNADIIYPYVSPNNAQLTDPNRPSVEQYIYRPSDTRGSSIIIGKDGTIK